MQQNPEIFQGVDKSKYAIHWPLVARTLFSEKTRCCEGFDCVISLFSDRRVSFIGKEFGIVLWFNRVA